MNKNINKRSDNVFYIVIFYYHYDDYKRADSAFYVIGIYKDMLKAKRIAVTNTLLKFWGDLTKLNNEIIADYVSGRKRSKNEHKYTEQFIDACSDEEIKELYNIFDNYYKNGESEYTCKVTTRMAYVIEKTLDETSDYDWNEE